MHKNVFQPMQHKVVNKFKYFKIFEIQPLNVLCQLFDSLRHQNKQGLKSP